MVYASVERVTLVKTVPSRNVLMTVVDMGSVLLMMVNVIVMKCSHLMIAILNYVLTIAIVMESVIMVLATVNSSIQERIATSEQD